MGEFLLVPAYPGSPDQRPLNGCVRACVRVCVIKYIAVVLAEMSGRAFYWDQLFS